MQKIDAEVDADEALLARVAASDRQDLEQLYARWASPLLAFFLRRVVNRAQAEEILQDTFVTAWQSAGSLEGRSTARS